MTANADHRLTPEAAADHAAKLLAQLATAEGPSAISDDYLFLTYYSRFAFTQQVTAERVLTAPLDMASIAFRNVLGRELGDERISSAAVSSLERFEAALDLRNESLLSVSRLLPNHFRGLASWQAQETDPARLTAAEILTWLTTTPAAPETPADLMRRTGPALKRVERSSWGEADDLITWTPNSVALPYAPMNGAVVVRQVGYGEIFRALPPVIDGAIPLEATGTATTNFSRDSTTSLFTRWMEPRGLPLIDSATRLPRLKNGQDLGYMVWREERCELYRDVPFIALGDSFKNVPSPTRHALIYRFGPRTTREIKINGNQFQVFARDLNTGQLEQDPIIVGAVVTKDGRVRLHGYPQWTEIAVEGADQAMVVVTFRRARKLDLLEIKNGKVSIRGRWLSYDGQKISG